MLESDDRGDTWGHHVGYKSFTPIDIHSAAGESLLFSDCVTAATTAAYR